MRRVRLLVLFLVLGQATGLLWPSAAAAGDGCEEPCEDEREGKTCPPLCDTCVCASRPAPSVPALRLAFTLLAASTSIELVFSAQRVPPTPEPHEILHVPRPLLA